MKDADQNAVILKSMTKLEHAWGLSDKQIANLLSISAENWAGQDRTALGEEQQMRAGLLLSIYKKLSELFHGPLVNRWVTHENTGLYFKGRSSLEIMLCDQRGIEAVLDYLTASST